MTALQIVAAVIGVAATIVGWTMFLTRIGKFVQFFKLGAPTPGWRACPLWQSPTGSP